MGRGDGGRAAEESSASAARAALANKDERPDLQTALGFLQQVHRLTALPRAALPLPTPRMPAGGFPTVRGTSLIRKRTLLGPYSSPMPRDLW